MNIDYNLISKKNYKFSFGFYIVLFPLFLISSIVIFAIVKFVIDQYTGKQNIDKELYIFAIFISTWFMSLIVMLRQKFVIKYAFSVSEEGIHNIIIGGIFLAFIIVLPIKFIPWESLKVKSNFGTPQISINSKELKEYSFLVRWIIRIKGFKLLNLYSKLDEDWYKLLIQSIVE